LLRVTGRANLHRHPSRTERQRGSAVLVGFWRRALDGDRDDGLASEDDEAEGSLLLLRGGGGGGGGGVFGFLGLGGRRRRKREQGRRVRDEGKGRI
jgi:hypothetical protein